MDRRKYKTVIECYNDSYVELLTYENRGIQRKFIKFQLLVQPSLKLTFYSGLFEFLYELKYMKVHLQPSTFPYK